MTSGKSNTHAVTVEVDLDAARPYDLEELADLLAGHHGAAAGDLSEATLEFDVDADSPGRAAVCGQEIAEDLLPRVGAHVMALRSVRAMSVAEQERFVASPAVPALVDVAEVARQLGVTKQRVAQLRNRPDFPDPVAELDARPVWTEASVACFVQSWHRRPGRRPKTASVEAAPALGLMLALLALLITTHLQRRGAGARLLAQVLPLPATVLRARAA